MRFCLDWEPVLDIYMGSNLEAEVVSAGQANAFSFNFSTLQVWKCHLRNFWRGCRCQVWCSLCFLHSWEIGYLFYLSSKTCLLIRLGSSSGDRCCCTTWDCLRPEALASSVAAELGSPDCSSSRACWARSSSCIIIVFSFCGKLDFYWACRYLEWLIELHAQFGVKTIAVKELHFRIQVDGSGLQWILEDHHWQVVALCVLQEGMRPP